MEGRNARVNELLSAFSFKAERQCGGQNLKLTGLDWHNKAK